MTKLRIRVLAGCAAGALAVVSLVAAPAISQSAAPVAQGRIDVKVLSSRYDLVSGGDALVEIKASEGAKASDLKVSLNGRELLTPLKFDQPTNTLRGLVIGLDNGANWLQVRGPSGYSVSQPLVNYPITGPILSGPHMAPYECRTKESGLGEPTDANCSAPTRYDWFYKPVDGGAYKAYDPKGPKPADVAMTTTIEGKTVPFIVRVESGVIDRSIYRLAVLDDPATPGFSAAEGWNGRLSFTFGGGAGTQYNQGVNQPQAVLSDLYLARGFDYGA